MNSDCATPATMSNDPIRLHLPDAQATDALGAALAEARARAFTGDARSREALIVHLHGDLGAGKSTLARALLRALGVRGAIRSPTYTLVERYPLGDGGPDDGESGDGGHDRGEAWHLDLYRIGDAGELEYLGLDGGEAVLWLIEWPERGLGWLPAPDLRVDLAQEGDGRQASLSALTASGRAWLVALAHATGGREVAGDS